MTPRSFAALLLALSPSLAFAQTYPTGFRQSHPLTGLSAPTQARFAHDGRIYVAEKSGRILVFDNLLDTTAERVADLGPDVHDYHDRGLLGMDLDPHFPERPYLYVLYTHNGGLFDDAPPRWPTTNCPTPPGATTQGGGCVVSGRLARLTVENGKVVATTLLVEDWYQQFPSHSIGSVRFGADGYLYAGGGDGASYNWGDWGQHGNPAWPDRRSPANQGGALRAQGMEVAEQYTDRLWLNGTIIRIDPATGAAAPGNPAAAPRGADAQAARIVAYGLRNPFRFTIRPGTSEIWIGDVGANTWEEINVIPATGADARLYNFGWPCFEGRLHNGLYAGRSLCATLYADGDSGGRTPVSPPWYTYAHTGSSAISGLAFYTGTRYPADYAGALFFADYNANRIRVIKDTDGDGLPDAPADGTAALFADGQQPGGRPADRSGRRPVLRQRRRGPADARRLPCRPGAAQSRAGSSDRARRRPDLRRRSAHDRVHGGQQRRRGRQGHADLRLGPGRRWRVRRRQRGHRQRCIHQHRRRCRAGARRRWPWRHRHRADDRPRAGPADLRRRLRASAALSRG